MYLVHLKRRKQKYVSDACHLKETNGDLQEKNLNTDLILMRRILPNKGVLKTDIKY